jgi:hypothetical protein
MSSNDNGWNEWEKKVLSDLQRLTDGQEKTNDKLDDFITDDFSKFRAEVRTEIALLKMKAGVWGAAAGVIPTVAAILLAIVLGWV